MTNYEMMLSGNLYHCKDEEIKKYADEKNEFLDNFNSTKFGDYATREQLVRSIFKHVGKSCFMNKPFMCDYGRHISVGDNFYSNLDLIILDVCDVEIGNNVLFGPRVSIYTAAHPIDAQVRNTGLEYGKKVKIGNNCWIGGSVTINPGVSIGDNVVIGSGSVVTKDIPSNVIAVGNPCRVIRSINEQDKKIWEAKKEEYYKQINK